MVLLVQAVERGIEHTIGWISLQPDGSVSVGLADQAFISPRFRARQFVWNAYNRVAVQYLVPHSPQELRAVTNPHLTFPPSHLFSPSRERRRGTVCRNRGGGDHARSGRPSTLDPVRLAASRRDSSSRAIQRPGPYYNPGGADSVVRCFDWLGD